MYNRGYTRGTPLVLSQGRNIYISVGLRENEGMITACNIQKRHLP